MLIIEAETQIDLPIKIRNEMSRFENEAARGHQEIVYQYFLRIFRTSIETKRTFSAAGFIANNIRSRFIDALIFLRST